MGSMQAKSASEKDSVIVWNGWSVDSVEYSKSKAEGFHLQLNNDQPYAEKMSFHLILQEISIQKLESLKVFKQRIMDRFEIENTVLVAMQIVWDCLSR